MSETALVRHKLYLYPFIVGLLFVPGGFLLCVAAWIMDDADAFKVGLATALVGLLGVRLSLWGHDLARQQSSPPQSERPPGSSGSSAERG